MNHSYVRHVLVGVLSDLGSLPGSHTHLTDGNDNDNDNEDDDD